MGKINLQTILGKAPEFFICLIAFCLPLNKALVPPLIILWAVSAFKNHVNPFKRGAKIEFVLLISLYLLYAIGCFFSVDKGAAYFDLQVKLSVLVFPLLSLITNNSTTELKKVNTSFVHGCLTAIVICSINAIYKYFFFVNEETFFFYSDLAYLHHPAYLAMFLTWAVIIQWFILIIDRQKTNYFSWLLICFFSLFILFLTSRNGIAAMLITNICGFTILILRTRAYIKGISLFIIGLLAMFITITRFSGIKSRIMESVDALNAEDNQKILKSSSMRITVWRTASELIKKQPLGYGTGDVKSVLKEAYKQKGYTFLAFRNLNAHNQFLQTALALGIIGGLLFIVVLIMPFFNRKEGLNWMYYCFALLFIFNCLTESMLETQAGVTFFAFFYTILLSCNTNKKGHPSGRPSFN